MLVQGWHPRCFCLHCPWLLNNYACATNSVGLHQVVLESCWSHMQCHMHPILSDRKQDIAFNSTLFTAEQGSFMVFSFSLDGHWQCPLDYEVDTIKCTLFCSGHWRVGFLWLPTIGGTLCHGCVLVYRCPVVHVMYYKCPS